MVERSEFFIPSTNEHNNLRVMMWKPTGNILAVLQISHGMIEHIERYNDFANYLARRGFLVVGNDHLGHGKSVSNNEELGYFNAPNSSKTVVDDLHKLTLLIKSEYQNLPYFLLGHSMGSFMARRYIMTYGNELDGAIIMGTGEKPSAVLASGKLLIRLMSLFKPMTYRSKLIEQISFWSYNKKFEPKRTKTDWLSRDTAQVDAYTQDPLCNFTFTLNGYQTLFDVLSFIRRAQNIKQIPKDLPIFMVSGTDDPVGDYGKTVTKIYNTYKDLGIQDINLKLYQSARHEILNELDREAAYENILNWLKDHINSGTLTQVKQIDIG